MSPSDTTDGMINQRWYASQWAPLLRPNKRTNHKIEILDLLTQLQQWICKTRSCRNTKNLPITIDLFVFSDFQDFRVLRYLMTILSNIQIFHLWFCHIFKYSADFPFSFNFLKSSKSLCTSQKYTKPWQYQSCSEYWCLGLRNNCRRYNVRQFLWRNTGVW